ncbi:hypothetical protein ASPCAL06716 [Aspergillus calidoustus]|uniref:Uncharacterized protein n=1 Tax=Aspergillus calidoustus TaxID=454130 RepID=A0A0U5G4X2_ASPCI|nr:hypothetical protein ASPCAL06716 [Aspergillus calidoustus]
MPAKFLPPQSSTTPATPLPYTASPWKLMWEDILLVLRSLWAVLNVILPLTPYNSGDLDELYPSPRNLANLAFQLVISLLQVIFLISIPVLIICMAPTLWTCVYIGGFILANRALCDLLVNRGSTVLVSRFPEHECPEHRGEHWVFINGVACGQTWLQSNIDRLGITFGRRVYGAHNPTAGLVFDLLQCLLQRDFSYATQDVRDAYVHLRAALVDPENKKVVLILHSQGGIEGGLIVDWLLDEIPQGLLRKLEIYTFGNAANHFNNPYRNLPAGKKNSQCSNVRNTRLHEPDNTILHIEHYANSREFVSVLGVLNFANIVNRYMGQVFVRPGTGHMFNQHYMDTMFTLGADGKVLDTNEFMDMEIDVPDSGSEGSSASTRRARVANLSRLWVYRNGGSPDC